MKRRIFTLLLVFAMVFSLFGCTQTPAETQPSQTTAPTETTAPMVTELSALDLYTQAKAAIDEASDLELTVNMTEKRTVGGETYTESATQTIALQSMGTDSLTASVEETITCGEYVYSSKEFFSQGTAYLMFDNLPFSAEITQEDYLSRLVPPVLLDESLYRELTAQPNGTTTTLTFSQPSVGESWAVPEYGELISAVGTVSIDENGALTRTGYTVSYTQGPTQVDLDISVTVTIPESLSLSNTLPVSQEGYVELEYIDAPALLYRAVYDIMQADTLTYSSTDTLITYAGGAIFSQQEALDLYGTGAEGMSNYDIDISLQDYSGTVDKYTLTENIQDGKLKRTENEGEPISQLLSDAQVEQARESYVDLVLNYIWDPSDLTGAKITDLGSVYLLEMTGNDALGDVYNADACSTFWMDENFLNDLATSYRTNKVEAYLSIDKYTQLPVSFGFAYEGVHEIEGGEYILSDQWDQTFFLGSNTAYKAITEENLPETEPENKATPLFYHVTGENGQEMWLLGTIHVGDERTAYLPQEIYDALDASDALAVEFDMDAFDDAVEFDDELLAQLQEAYFYPDGSATKDHLDEDVYDSAVQLLKATGNYYMNAEYIKPYLWSQSIDNFNLQQGYVLVSDKGMDQRLLDLAQEKEMEVLDIESGLFQIQMLTGYSEELQQLLLEESMATDSAEYCAGVAELYELWCSGDEAALREELSSEVDTSEFTEDELAEYEAQLPLIEEYNKAMTYDRNEGMLDTAIEYLESGETIFYAVGLAHLLDNVNGLVDTLREAGYTVELVTYK